MQMFTFFLTIKVFTFVLAMQMFIIFLAMQMFFFMNVLIMTVFLCTSFLISEPSLSMLSQVNSFKLFDLFIMLFRSVIHVYRIMIIRVLLVMV